MNAPRTNICSVRIAVFCLIYETSLWNIYNHQKHCDETKQTDYLWSKAKAQGNRKQDNNEPDHRYLQSDADHLKHIEGGAVISSEDWLTCCY